MCYARHTQHSQCIMGNTQSPWHWINITTSKNHHQEPSLGTRARKWLLLSPKKPTACRVSKTTYCIPPESPQEFTIITHNPLTPHPTPTSKLSPIQQYPGHSTMQTRPFPQSYTQAELRHLLYRVLTSCTFHLKLLFFSNSFGLKENLPEAGSWSKLCHQSSCLGQRQNMSSHLIKYHTITSHVIPSHTIQI